MRTRSAPILARRAFTWLSTVRVPDAPGQPHTSASSRSRVSTTPGLAARQQQEVELGRRQVHLVVAGPHPAGSGVDAQVAQVGGAAAGQLRGAVDPTQQCGDPRDQLAHPERLGEVVVGADGQPDEDVGLVVACGEHQHRHRPDGLDAPAHLVPVEAGEHHVEDDQVRVAGR